MASDSLTNFVVLLNRQFRRCEIPFGLRILLHHTGAVCCCLWEKRQVLSAPSHEPVCGLRTRSCAGGWPFLGPLLEEKSMRREYLPRISNINNGVNSVGKNKHKNTLIVEDNLIVGMVLKNMLLKLDEPADLAVTGEEAIEKVKIHRYGLILMDIGLPVKDGCAVTKIIRDWEKNHQLQPAYIVAQSSHLDPELEKQCLAVGMNACYHKPLSLETIANLLKTINCLT